MSNAFRIVAVCTLLSGLGFSLREIRHSDGANSALASGGTIGRVDADNVRTLRLELESQWGRAFPPPGTPCWLPWEGFSAHGSLFQIASYNCFDSVCYLTSGDSSNFSYRAWPSRTFSETDSPAAWLAFERSLRRGDVVEFVAQIRERNGTIRSSPFHAQICAADGGLMVGANNEPRFVVVRGVPTETMKWDFCTTREYYEALKAMDQAWRDCGEEHAYTMVIHSRPIVVAAP